MQIPDDPYAFHPLVKRWFHQRIGRPTPIQEAVWPRIANGDHVLLTAPTGSGKTLAAFLCALDRLIREGHHDDGARILYVSPLKALNNDVRQNLIRPLAQIRRLFEAEGVSFPAIRVATRSGDTPANERRKMLRQPPQILITTPESLHLLLSSHGGLSVLAGIRVVILDEIHAVVATKRGSLMMSAVDRLVPLCGEFQRIALSATVRPISVVADFVGGYRLGGDPSDPVYVQRPIRLCQSTETVGDRIAIRMPKAVTMKAGDVDLWNDLADHLRQSIAACRSTLVFTNSRRLCEKLTYLINAGRQTPIAYAHHGSLSRQLRLDVEQRLKRGELKAIIATASLELGIDVGALDQVILVQSPPSVSSAIQRIGRSGHGVGRHGRATFFATHAVDGIIATALAKAVLTRELEPLQFIDAPLDVLAQVLVSMIGMRPWNIDRLFFALRTTAPFHHLSRRHFDLVIEMLAGRYAATRIPTLSARIVVDRLSNMASARKGALLAVYAGGGVIPDRGYFDLRHEKTDVRIGELDEEFVWEARKGQVFTLGTQNWRIQRITHNAVFVLPADSRTSAPPFWRAEEVDRDFHLAAKIGTLLEEIQRRVDRNEPVDEWLRQTGLDSPGADFLAEFLNRQIEHTGCALPHRHHVVVEVSPAVNGPAGSWQLVIHTFWGGRVNRPFALALATAWEKRYRQRPTILPTNDAIYLFIAKGGIADPIMELVPAADMDALIKASLEASGRFGARFRECAARALLLPRQKFNQRMPLWLSRQQSQRLLEAVSRFTDFPILLEAWRSCLQDDFDLPALSGLLNEMATGRVAVSQVHTRFPSPMARAGSWRPINQWMYADDRQQGRVQSDLSRELINPLVGSPTYRPAVDATVVAIFEEKRQRLAAGYAPDTPLELLAWVQERLMIPLTEWQVLLNHCATDSGLLEDDLLMPIEEKLIRFRPHQDGGPTGDLILAREMACGIHRVLYDGVETILWLDLKGQPQSAPDPDDVSAAMDGAEVLGQWLRYYGPVDEKWIHRSLGMDASTLSDLLADLTDRRALVVDVVIDGQSGSRVCDADNFDILLRMARRQRTSTIETLPARRLALALAHFQGVTAPHTSSSPDALPECLDRLTGLFLPARLWETEVLPARLMPYDSREMDFLIQSSEMMWIGAKGRQITFCNEADLDLITDEAMTTDTDGHDAIQDLFPDPSGRYPLVALLGDPPRPAQTVLAELWDAVWQGRVTNDTLMALRRILYQEKHSGQATATMAPTLPVAARQTGSRRHRRRPESSRMIRAVGNWHLIQFPSPPDGALETQELIKDRVRLLIDRYGILFRQLLTRESRAFQWAAVFQTLRLMELAGEVVGGYFFSGIEGIQFVSQPMLRLLRQPLPEETVFWINAQDPASLCGLRIRDLDDPLPQRFAGTHLVYWGSRLAMFSRRQGMELTIHLPPDHPRLTDCFALFDHLLGRRIEPLSRISVKTINQRPASASPYLEFLRTRFDIVVETQTITIYRARIG